MLTKNELKKVRYFLAEFGFEHTVSELENSTIIETFEEWKKTFHRHRSMLERVDERVFSGENLKFAIEEETGKKLSKTDFFIWKEMFKIFCQS